MQLNLVPRSSPQELELRRLFSDSRFQALLESIQAEFDFESWSGKVDFASHLLSESQNLDADAHFKRAARLLMALEVLEEFAKPDKQHYQLTADTL